MQDVRCSSSGLVRIYPITHARRRIGKPHTAEAKDADAKIEIIVVLVTIDARGTGDKIVMLEVGDERFLVPLIQSSVGGPRSPILAMSAGNKAETATMLPVITRRRRRR